MGWTWIWAGVVTIACVAGGCADRDRPEPTQLEVYSSAKLETAPLKVRTAFRDDYPGAVVHDVQTVSPRSGLLQRLVHETRA